SDQCLNLEIVERLKVMFFFKVPKLRVGFQDLINNMKKKLQ
ncbi:16440_t:CDS:2, partial [Entrophospora sp. SA101]